MTNVRVVTEADGLTIKIDMADMAKELSGLVEHWPQRAERLRAQWEESEWYLGELIIVDRSDSRLYDDIRQNWFGDATLRSSRTGAGGERRQRSEFHRPERRCSIDRVSASGARVHHDLP